MKKLTEAFLILVLSFSFLCGCSVFSQGYYKNEQIIFANSAIKLSVKLYGKKSKKAYNKMVEELTALDKEISLSRTDSKLYYFNETLSENEKLEISAVTYDIIEQSLLLEEETDYAFSIGVYNLSKLWHLDTAGYSAYNKLDGTPLNFELPTMKEVAQAKLHCDTSVITLTKSDRKYYIEKSDKLFRIDLGAVAKGYCADICYKIMRDYELKSGIADISGNVAVLNGFYDGENYSAWEFGVSAPRPRVQLYGRDDVCAVEIEQSVSLVTSGDYERFYVHESGIVPCHIINPVSGLPAGVEYIEGTYNSYKMSESYISSVTIFAASSTLADAYSTAAFVKGLEEGYGFLNIKQTNGVKAIMFSENYDGINTSFAYMAVVGDITFYREDYFNGFKNYQTYTG